MVWDVHEHYWQQMYEKAFLFYVQNGHLRLPSGVPGTDDRALYEWLQGQKRTYKQGKLSTEHVSLLRKIGLKLGDGTLSDFYLTDGNQGYGDRSRA